ncbi:hypothetical protein HanRHA438_Chr14g0653401 [Helianthus annuus]|nr:hypothetical protein HanRHA438_Chr14g0653401 [Helianthus annuus]
MIMTCRLDILLARPSFLRSISTSVSSVDLPIVTCKSIKFFCCVIPYAMIQDLGFNLTKALTILITKLKETNLHTSDFLIYCFKRRP